MTLAGPYFLTLFKKPLCNKFEAFAHVLFPNYMLVICINLEYNFNTAADFYQPYGLHMRV